MEDADPARLVFLFRPTCSRVQEENVRPLLSHIKTDTYPPHPTHKLLASSETLDSCLISDRQLACPSRLLSEKSAAPPGMNGRGAPFFAIPPLDAPRRVNAAPAISRTPGTYT